MKTRGLKESLLILSQKTQGKAAISIEEILEILSGKGRSLILILLSLPFCQPFQIPGLSTPFGLFIAFIGFRMAFGKSIWLPKSVMSKTIPSSTLQKISQNGLKFMKKIAHLIHPRLKRMCHHRIMYVSNGLLIVLLGIFLALPLPIPLTNIIAGWAILFMAIGLLEDDGVFILLGYFVSLLIIAFFILLTLSIEWMLWMRNR